MYLCLPKRSILFSSLLTTQQQVMDPGADMFSLIKVTSSSRDEQDNDVRNQCVSLLSVLAPAFLVHGQTYNCGDRMQRRPAGPARWNCPTWIPDCTRSNRGTWSAHGAICYEGRVPVSCQDTPSIETLRGGSAVLFGITGVPRELKRCKTPGGRVAV